jgi:hypothetical protein
MEKVSRATKHIEIVGAPEYKTHELLLYEPVPLT